MTTKERLDEMFKGKYGEAISLHDYMAMCIREEIWFDKSVLLQCFEQYLGRSKSTVEGSPVVLDGNHIRLHTIEDDQEVEDLLNNERIILKKALIHYMDYDPEREKKLSNWLVFTSVDELERVIGNIKRDFAKKQMSQGGK